MELVLYLNFLNQFAYAFWETSICKQLEIIIKYFILLNSEVFVYT